MEATQLVVDRAEARRLWRDYRKHQHYSAPIDAEIQRTYQLIAQGRVIIKAIESIVEAGLDQEDLPKLAIVRADAEHCFWRPNPRGGGVFCRKSIWNAERLRDSITIADGTWSGQQQGKWQFQAITPIIPLPLRPKRGLENYHVLFEAEWTRAIPLDPILLRRVGRGDIWLVVAAWDLTPVEQAALAARLNG